MKYSIVVTTINVPKLLEKHAKDVATNNSNCFFVVVGDKKTPKEARTYCEKLSKKTGVEIVFLDILVQEKYLKRFPELKKHIPYNSDSRRSIGILYSYERGVDVMITIDDDNHLHSKDFAKKHTVGIKKNIEILSSKNKWLNACMFLKEKYGRTIYHRGIPPEARYREEKIKSKKQNVKVIANGGLWMEDPDIDAIDRWHFMGKPMKSIGLTRKDNFALAKNNWCPFNSQNISVAREALPAYFLGPIVGRHNDIWGSLVIQKIAHHLNHVVSFGLPLVDHKQAHKTSAISHWKDFLKEYNGMILTTHFVNSLEKVSLRGKTYETCYKELAEKLPKVFKTNYKLTPELEKFFDGFIEGMNVWSKTFERIK